MCLCLRGILNNVLTEDSVSSLRWFARSNQQEGTHKGSQHSLSLTPACVKSLPHWPLLLMPKVKSWPLEVKATVWALPRAICVTTTSFRSVTWPAHTNHILQMMQRSPSLQHASQHTFRNILLLLVHWSQWQSGLHGELSCSLQFLPRAAEFGLRGWGGGPPLVYESSSACCSWVTSARFAPLSGSQEAPKDPRARKKSTVTELQT